MRLANVKSFEHISPQKRRSRQLTRSRHLVRLPAVGRRSSPEKRRLRSQAQYQAPSRAAPAVTDDNATPQERNTMIVSNDPTLGSHLCSA